MVLNMEIHETLVKASFGEGRMDGSEQSGCCRIVILELLHLFFLKQLHVEWDRVFIYIYAHLDLPKGAKWFLKGVNSPSLRV